MAFTYRSQSAVASGTTSLTITAPAGLVEHDLLVMALVHHGDAYATVPDGWTLVGQAIASGVRGEVYVRRASSSEPASYAVTGLADAAQGVILAYSGPRLTGAVVDVSSIVSNAASASGAPSITPTVDHALVLACQMHATATLPGGSISLDHPSADANFGLRSRVNASLATGPGTGLGVAEGLWDIAGATGDVLGFSSSAANVALLVSFIPQPTDTETVTRFYATKRAVGTELLGPQQGDWSATDSTRAKRGDHHWTFLLSPEKAGAGVVSTLDAQVLSTPGIPDEHLIAARFVTPQLTAQSCPSSLTVCFRVRKEDAAPSTAAYWVHGYVTQGDSLTPRHTMLQGQTAGSAWTTTATWREATFSLAGAGIQEGDRICLEMGAICRPFDATSSNVYRCGWGTQNRTGLVTHADASDSTTGDGAAWVEFSSPLRPYADRGAAPDNWSAVGATPITTVPYQAGPIDTTGSPGVNRAVWWTWVADRTGRMFVSTLGGNYGCMTRVMSGTLGALVNVSVFSTAKREGWIGTSQSVSWFDAVQGTRYWFEVQSYALANSETSAFSSGGALKIGLWAYEAPVTGDLVVSCQHLVAYRDGRLLNVQSGLYGSTPTNSVADYSGVPIVDLNTSLLHTADRLYVDVFGATPLVEIFDLATLNVGEFELDFILNALNPATHSENASSIVMDTTPAGTPRILVGFFGDDYDVVGHLSSADAGAVRRLPLDHADNQPAAPFGEAETFSVAFETGGSDYIELSSDGSTLFYASAGRTILRYDLALDVQLAPFATLPAQDGPRPGLRGLRLLPPYDGSGGLLVCDGVNVTRLDATGSVVQTYTPTPDDQARDLDKLELVPQGDQFWVSDQYSTWMFKFDVATGVQVQAFDTKLPPGQLCGFTIIGYRQAGRPHGGSSTPRVLPIRRVREAPHLTDEKRWYFYQRFELLLETGVGLVEGQGTDPQIMLQYSDDRGETWSYERWTTAGRIGQDVRALWYRLGRSRGRIFRIVVSDPVEWVFVDATLEALKGLS